MFDTDAPSPMNLTVEPMPEAECRRLLGSQTLGRVGVTNGGLPLILPVHYRYVDGAITFRSGAGTKLRAAANGDVLAFEVDSYDATTGTGWSVMVLGRASVLATADELAGLPMVGEAADGEHNHYVRLSCELVTGRFIGADHS